MQQKDYSKIKFPPKGFVTSEKTKEHAEMLANRIRKRFRHLSRWFKRENIESFRLYDWDIIDLFSTKDIKEVNTCLLSRIKMKAALVSSKYLGKPVLGLFSREKRSLYMISLENI